VRCPACRTTQSVDLRTLDRHPFAALTSFIPAHLDDKLRAEIGEIADTLQGNLDKIVQHGKRADAIVKNMLLHSRQGSGEYRPVDVNALVEESLNLAYHGARAEKQGFEITLERSFDRTTGEVDLFPQEITRVLLNLISNGFYATTKRKAEKDGGDYEPTLTATTKNLGEQPDQVTALAFGSSSRPLIPGMMMSDRIRMSERSPTSG
jgi:signal transduction histidine kinase